MEEIKEKNEEDAQDLDMVVQDHIDLEPIIRDAIGIALPFIPLCSEDCEGLCSQCGIAYEDLPDDHEHEILQEDVEDIFSALERELKAKEEGSK